MVLPSLANSAGGLFELVGNALTAKYNLESTKATNEAQIALMREQNQFNSAEAEKARLFNAEQAQKQRDYETSMSNTAYQRARADMEAAGINPILAAGNGGAGTPVGAYAEGSAAHAASTANLDVPLLSRIITNSAVTAFKRGLTYQDEFENFNKAASTAAKFFK